MPQNIKKNKRVFITGGAGYVGASLTPYLIEKGYEVTVLDLMIYGESVLKKNSNLKIIKGDIRDTELLKKEVPGHDVLIHLACISNDPSFELNPSLVKSINLDNLSVNELKKYIDQLKKEVDRVNLEIQKKIKLQSKADDIFK